MKSHSLKDDVALYRAFVAAGFKLASVKSMEARDGVAWSTEVAHQGVKFLRVSNGGFGGPDELDVLLGKPGNRDQAGAMSLANGLFKLPEVDKWFRGRAVELEEETWHYAVEREHRERVEKGETTLTVEAVREELGTKSAARVKSLREDPITPSEDDVGTLIGALSDIHSSIKALKRSAAKGIAFFVKSKPDNWMTIKAADTPENRKRAELRYGEEMDGYVADALIGL